MSGIFGFIRRGLEGQKLDGERLRALEKWNVEYGCGNAQVHCAAQYALGVYPDDISPRGAASNALIYRGHIYAAIDALIYNREELIAGFEGDAGDYSALSDSELVFEIISRRGMHALREINGDFAGAMYDAHTEELKLFRDHLGVRPLYVYTDAQLLAFSSDIRALTSMPDADLSLNEQLMYLRMQYANTLSLDSTDFARISCVCPGGWIYIRSTAAGFAFERRTYWEPRLHPTFRKDAATGAWMLRSLVEDAVKRRLDAVSGRVGADLSGGLDSSVLAILAAEFGENPLCISWSASPIEYPVQENDERIVIAQICSLGQMRCEYLPIPELNDAYYERLTAQVVSPEINTRQIGDSAARFHAAGVRAVLSGHGGDEGASHRCSPYEIWRGGEYIAFFKEMWRVNSGKNLRILRTLRSMRRNIAYGRRLCNEPWYFYGADGSSIASEDFARRMRDTPEPQPLFFSTDPARYILQGGLRSRLDNLAMQGAQHKIRYLTPLLDYRVIDFALSLPRRLFYEKGVSRKIYRNAFCDLLPEALFTSESKDAFGMKPPNPDENRRHFVAVRNAVWERLDKIRWAGYIDFERARGILDENELKPVSWRALDVLFRCLMIQNLQDCGRGRRN